MTPMAHVLAAAGSKLFKAGEIPVLPDMLEQMKVGRVCCCCCLKCTFLEGCRKLVGCITAA